jgi:hypothetical protein
VVEAFKIGKATLPDAEPGCSGMLEVEFLDDEAYLVFFDDCASTGNRGPYHARPPRAKTTPPSAG